MREAEFHNYSPLEEEAVPWIEESSFEVEDVGSQLIWRATSYLKYAVVALVLLLCGVIVGYNLQTSKGRNSLADSGLSVCM